MADKAQAGQMTPMHAAFSAYEQTDEFKEAISHVQGVTKPSAIVLWAFRAGWEAAKKPEPIGGHPAKRSYEPVESLISRRIVPAGDNAVSVIELWDTSHPSSPFTVIKFNEKATMPNPYERVFILSNEEFREIGIKPYCRAGNK